MTASKKTAKKVNVRAQTEDCSPTSTMSSSSSLLASLSSSFPGSSEPPEGERPQRSHTRSFSPRRISDNAAGSDAKEAQRETSERETRLTRHAKHAENQRELLKLVVREAVVGLHLLASENQTHVHRHTLKQQKRQAGKTPANSRNLARSHKHQVGERSARTGTQAQTSFSEYLAFSCATVNSVASTSRSRTVVRAFSPLTRSCRRYIVTCFRVVFFVFVFPEF